MVRVACFIVSFLFAAASALASPAVRTSGYYTGGGSVSEGVVLGVAPRNGDRVTILDTASSPGSAPTKIADSNGVSLSLVYSVSGANYGLFTYSYFVTGSPTGTYTCTVNAASSCQRMIAVELSGTFGDTPSYAGTYGSSITPTSGPLATNSGDLLICMVDPIAQTMSISNSTGLTTIGAVDEGYAFASSTSSTCSGSASATSAIASMADYPSGPSTGSGVYPYPLNFQAAFAQ